MKLQAIFITIILTLTLTACDKPQQPPEPTATETTTPITEQKPTKPTKAEPKPEPTQQTTQTEKQTPTETTQPQPTGKYLKGTHYKHLPKAKATTNKEVLEYFWYGCHHCDAFDPHVQRWLKTKPKDVTFRHMPVAFHKTAELHAKAYYTAEILKITDKIHQPFFHAIHREKKRLETVQALADFFSEKANISPPVFRNTIQSFPISNHIRKVKSSTREHQVTGVPYLVVNGQYATSPSMIKDGTPIFDIVNYLLTLKN